MIIFNKEKYQVFSSNFHLSTLFQHFGGQYIKFIVTYCNTKRGKRNIWLLLIVSTNLHQIKKNTAFPKTENFVEFISRNVCGQPQVMFMGALCYIFLKFPRTHQSYVQESTLLCVFIIISSNLLVLVACALVKCCQSFEQTSSIFFRLALPFARQLFENKILS